MSEQGPKVPTGPLQWRGRKSKHSQVKGSGGWEATLGHTVLWVGESEGRWCYRVNATMYGVAITKEAAQAEAEKTAQDLEEPKKPLYADAAWTIADILDRWVCTPEQARAFLEQNEKHLRDWMIEKGWGWLHYHVPYPERPQDDWGEYDYEGGDEDKRPE